MRCGVVVLVRHSNNNNRDNNGKDTVVGRGVVGWMICYFRVLYVLHPPTPERNLSNSGTRNTFFFKVWLHRTFHFISLTPFYKYIHQSYPYFQPKPRTYLIQ